MHRTRGELTYQNAGNPALLELVSPTAKRVLDVGCGAGDNARLLTSERPQTEVFGITISEPEAEVARAHMRQCWVADLERDGLGFLEGRTFDCIILSHVLEHLSDPALVLSRLIRSLEQGGQVLIAVPNVVYWRYRAQLAWGSFDYEDAGVFDRTHLRFYTVASAPRELVEPVEGLELVRRSGEGSVPLWLLRRHLLPRSMSRRIDAFGVRMLPGLFAGQILLACRKTF